MDILYNSKLIDAGDIVEHFGETCFVAYVENAYVKSLEADTEYRLEFPYKVISLNTGEKINSFKDRTSLNDDTDIKLLAKNNMATIIIERIE